MQRKWFKKLTALTLTLVMLLSMIPVSATDDFVASEGLYFRILQQDSDGNYYADVVPNKGLCGAAQLRPGESRYVQMCYVDANNVETPLSINDSDLVFPPFVSTSILQNDPTLIKVDYLQEGSGTISYTAPNGNTFSHSWICGLNRVDCYSASSASKAALLMNEFDYNDSSDTFYIAAKDNWVITDIQPVPEFPDIYLLNFANVTLDSSGKFATVKVTANLEGLPQHCVAYCTVTNGNETYQDQVSITINDTHPALKFREAVRNNNTWSESTDNGLQNTWYTAPTYNINFTAYYVDSNGTETKVPRSDLVISDPAKLSTSNSNDREDTNPGDDYIIRLEALEFTNSPVTVSYRNDPNAYPIKVEVDLPTAGYYRSNQSPSRDNYIHNEFTVTDTNKIFYLVAKDGWVISHFELQGDFADIATHDFVPTTTQQVVTITIKDDATFNSGHYFDTAFVATKAGGSDSRNGRVGVRLIDHRTRLTFYRVHEDHGNLVLDDRAETIWTPGKGDIQDVRFYLESGTGKTALNWDDIVYDNTHVSIEQSQRFSNDPTVARLKAKDWEDSTFTYTDNNIGTTYTIPIVPGLPPVGFYSSTTASESTYITELDFTGTPPSVFYVVPLSGWTLTDVQLRGQLGNIAILEWKSGDPYAKITVNAAPDPYGEWCGVESRATSVHEGTTRGSRDITINDVRPQLKFRWANWNENNESWEESPGERFNNYWYTAPGCDGILTVYHVDSNGAETPIPLSDLVISDTTKLSVCNANDPEDTNSSDDYIIQLIPKAFCDDTIEISYTQNSNAAPIRVNISLPNMGFYSSNQSPSKNTYITSFNVTDTSKTFYLVAQDGWTITSFRLRGDLSNIATHDFDPSNPQQVVTIAIKDDATFNSDRGFDVEAKAKKNDGSDSNENNIGITLKDYRTRLIYRDVWEENGSIRENDSLNAEWTPGLGDSHTIRFYLQSNGSMTALDWSDITYSGNHVDIEQWHGSNDPTVARIQAKSWDPSAFSYTYNGTNYTIPVNPGLPPTGLYRSTTPSKSDFLTEIDFNGTDPCVFYLVPLSGWTLTDVQLRGQLTNIATLEWNSGAPYAKITVNEAPNPYGEWCGVESRATSSHEGSIGGGRGITINDVRPQLKFRWLSWESGSAVESNGGLSTHWYPARGNGADVRFYLVENGSETPLDYDQLRADGQVITLEHMDGYDDSFVHLQAIAFGNGSVSYVDGSGNVICSMPITSQLPEIGLFSATGSDADEDTHLTSFTVTDSNNTIYLATRGNWRLTGVQLNGDFANFATVAVDQSGTYATITVTGSFRNGNWYDLNYQAVDANNPSNTTNNGTGLNLYDARTALYFEYLRPSESNGTMTYTPTGDTSTQWFPAKNETTYVRFFLDGAALSLNDLTVTGPATLRQAPGTSDTSILEMQCTDWNNATVQYTANGKTYTVSIEPMLPDAGFYSDTQATMGNYISGPLVVNDDDDGIFYLFPYNGWSITAIRGTLKRIADIEPVSNGNSSYYKITLTRAPDANTTYHLECTLTNGNRTGNYGVFIIFQDNRPQLMFTPLSEDGNGGFVENRFQNEWWGVKGSITRARFYLVQGQTKTLIDRSELTSDGLVMQMTDFDTGAANDQAVLLKALKFGTGSISYTDGNGKTYSIPFNCDPPAVGFYTDSAGTQNSFVIDFTVDANNKTFYLVGVNGWTIQNLRPEPDFADIATFTKLNDSTYKVEINNNAQSGTLYALSLDAANPTTGENMPNYLCDIKLFSAITEHTVTFDANSGNCATPSAETVDHKLTSLPNATRSGYTFNGWFTAASGGNKVSTSTVFSEDTIVYAQWTQNSSGTGSGSGGGSSSGSSTPSTPTPPAPSAGSTPNPSSPTTNEQTQQNADGSTTKTETKQDGTTVETTTGTDGSTTTTASKTETQQNSDGSTVTTTSSNTSATTASGDKVTEEKVEQKVENADGSTTTTTATKTETQTASGGKVTEEKVEEKKENADGSTTTTTTTTSSSTDAQGKTTNSSTVEKTVETKTGSTTTTTTTTEKPNGTTVKSETVAETVKNEDGTQSTTSKTETSSSDGSKSTTTVDENGKVESEVKLTGSAINVSNRTEEPVALPMPSLPVTNSSQAAPTVSVDMPNGKKDVTVEIPVTEVTDGTVVVIVYADGTEAVVKDCFITENGVAVTLEGDATIKVMDNSQNFDDVSEDQWFHDAADFMSARGLMNGTGEDQFSPNADSSRAMVWTMLASLNDQDTSAGNTWYEKSQDWAKENNVSDGTNPDGSISRQELALMLWAEAGRPASNGSFDDFNDKDNVDTWAAEAMRWALENGIMGGKGNGILDPRGHATRGEVAQMFKNFVSYSGQN